MRKRDMSGTARCDECGAKAEYAKDCTLVIRHLELCRAQACPECKIAGVDKPNDIRLHRRKCSLGREAQRRHRVMHGWAFRDLSDAEVKAIRLYLAGGPVPKGYEQVDRAVS